MPTQPGNAQPQATQRQWTIMVYLAGDNDLEAFGRKDLAEMKVIGSTDAVAVVAQFDCMADSITRRYYLTRDRPLQEDCIAQLPEVNTGDPAALVDFVLWAARAYPAKRYALILWNHGAGWKDDDIYQVVQRQGATAQITRAQVRSLGTQRTRRALFATTLEKLVREAVQTERAILFDDSSADFLDNQEMRAVLQRIVQELGRPLDLVGCDACLMNMLEVAYQMRDLCHILVGSQEVEPGDGWPYDRLLAPLRENPALEPGELGRLIVQSYIDHYRTHHPDTAVTQSALNLAAVEPLADCVSALGSALQAALAAPAGLGRLFAALRSAQTFTDRDYIDLVHLCRLLTTDDQDEISRLAGQVASACALGGPLVAAEAHHGAAVANAGGLSIYLPVRTLSPLYRHLEFAQRHTWDEFLETLVNPR
ncbi:MAG TPA: clostripain-related cysteine peptidase [Caldilineaceae bacterium]|nr:clostripain-related cysteine peptidase [Caldilineaceae bacterium]